MGHWAWVHFLDGSVPQLIPPFLLPIPPARQPQRIGIRRAGRCRCSADPQRRTSGLQQQRRQCHLPWPDLHRDRTAWASTSTLPPTTPIRTPSTTAISRPSSTCRPISSITVRSAPTPTRTFATALVVNFTADAPQHSFLRNFQFSSIVTAQSGRPFTLFAGQNTFGDVAGLSTDRVGGAPVSSACTSVTELQHHDRQKHLRRRSAVFLGFAPVAEFHAYRALRMTWRSTPSTS